MKHIIQEGRTAKIGKLSLETSPTLWRLSNTGLSIRVPHSPTEDIKSVWSLALAWNTTTGALTGVFEVASDKDTQFLLDALNSDKHFHPLAFPLYLATSTYLSLG